MTTIQLNFPWGRYYAHPWGINPVRLREAEWPPSPWRLLRALVAAWFRERRGAVPSADLVRLIENLAGTLPEVGSKQIAFGHTVHYQPNFGKADAGEKAAARYSTARHENHFVAVHGPVLFRWAELDLAESQKALLTELLAGISYFGRSESLCHAALAPDDADVSNIGWCRPVTTAGSRKISSQCRDVFCPKPNGGFQITDLWARRNGKHGKPKFDAPDAPQHLVDVLLSTDMKADGAAWFSYAMPEGWPERWVVRTPRTERADQSPTRSLSDGPKVAHYLRFSLQCRVPIPQRFTVDISERFRAAANSYVREGVQSYALLGKPERPDTPHHHAFFLPIAADLNQPGMLTDLHIWCEHGFTREEVDVMLRVRRLPWGSRRYPVNPVLIAMAMEPPDGTPIATRRGKLASRIWRSVTPFVPSLHFYRGTRKNPKVKANASPEMQLADCLRRAGVEASVTIRRLQPSATSAYGLNASDTVPPMSAWEIVRAPDVFEHGVEASVHQASSDSAPASHDRRIGFFFEIEFEQPQPLPLPALGHSCHFGLGLFAPVV